MKRPQVGERHHHPACSRDPADDRDDQDQGLDGDLVDPAGVVERIAEGVADTVTASTRESIG